MTEEEFWQLVRDKLDNLADHFDGSDDIQYLFEDAREDLHQLIGIISEDKREILGWSVHIPREHLHKVSLMGVSARWEEMIELQRFKDSDGLC